MCEQSAKPFNAETSVSFSNTVIYKFIVFFFTVEIRANADKSYSII